MRKMYDWPSWFGKGRVVLIHGEHYHCSQSSFSQQIRNAAGRLGLRVRVTDGRDRFTVVRLGRIKAAATGVNP